MVRLLLLVTLFLAAPAFAESQQNLPDWAAPADAYTPPAPDASSVLPPSPPTAPPAVPLDGGLSLLALAGAGYAAKRLKDRRAD